jgi:hypothetical protein
MSCLYHYVLCFPIFNLLKIKKFIHLYSWSLLIRVFGDIYNLASWLWWPHRMYCKVFSFVQLFCCYFIFKKFGLGQAQWIEPVILDTWETNIGRIVA